MGYKLTIAIPTYNRKDMLERCLNSIIPQMDKDIEIFISDNASSDGTEEMVREKFNYPFIRYRKNEENIGSDRNFIQCFNNGQGEYIHMLSDDDIILPGTIEAILEYIALRPSMICLNSCIIKENENVMLNTEYRKHEDMMNFIEDAGVQITFLSGMVLRQEYVNKVKDKDRFIGTNFPQSYIALECLAQGTNAIVKKTPGIGFQDGGAYGYNFYHVWTTEYLKLINYLVKLGCSQKRVRKFAIKSLNRDIVGFILGFRIYGTDLDMSGRKELLLQIAKYPQCWVLLMGAAYTPRVILQIGSKIKHIIIR